MNFRYKKWLILVEVLMVVAVLVMINKIGQLREKPIEAEQPQKKTCDHCNIVFIDVDILRADALPCYGYFRNTTPNICSFGQKSTLFTDNYSASFWTLPDIFSTITSLYPSFHGVETEYVDSLDPTIPTMAETFKNEGYQTVFIGESGNLAILNKENGGLRGFDLITKEPVETVIANLSQSSKPWFIYYYTPDLHMPYLLTEGVEPIDKNMVAPKNLPTTENEFKPLLNTYLKKHYVEIFKEKAIDEYSSIILAPDEIGSTAVTHLFNNLRWDSKRQKEYLINAWEPIFNTYMESFDENNTSDVAYVRMLYDTNINVFDNSLGSLLQKLETKPLADETITVIMSNHGEAFGEHGTFSHSSNSHTELFHTPLIIHAPQLTQKQVEQTSSNLDIFPTLLELTGISQVAGLQGKSLVSDVDQDSNPKRFVFSEDDRAIILQNKNWLYFSPEYPSGIKNSILYNKIADPAEKINVAEQYPELTSLLYEQATDLRSSSNSATMSGTKKTIDYSKVNLDPEKVERLQKEGYY